MLFELRVDGNNPDDIASLSRWLSGDDRLGPGVEVALAHTADPTHMGVLDDVITVVGVSLTAAQLFLSIEAWRRSRGQAPQVDVTEQRSNDQPPPDEGGVSARRDPT